MKRNEKTNAAASGTYTCMDGCVRVTVCNVTSASTLDPLLDPGCGKAERPPSRPLTQHTRTHSLSLTHSLSRSRHSSLPTRTRVRSLTEAAVSRTTRRSCELKLANNEQFQFTLH